MPASKARVKANRKYNLKTYRQIMMQVRIDTYGELLEWLDSKPSKTAYILDLIQKDMKRSKENNWLKELAKC